MKSCPNALGPSAARRVLVALALGVAAGLAAAAEPPIVTAHDLLRDARFQSAYKAALGPKAKVQWLSRLSNSAPVRDHRFESVQYQVATPCKPHDCSDNNLLLLYASASGKVVGRLVEKGQVTWIGTPGAALSSELDRLWKREFRQQVQPETTR
jgi:hypothetical protein